MKISSSTVRRTSTRSPRSAGSLSGMRAARILRLARRCAGRVSARARGRRPRSRRVVRPPTSRSVSATWASRSSAGWQHRSMRRSCSSPTSACSPRSAPPGRPSAVRAVSSGPRPALVDGDAAARRSRRPPVVRDRVQPARRVGGNAVRRPGLDGLHEASCNALVTQIQSPNRALEEASACPPSSRARLVIAAVTASCVLRAVSSARLVPSHRERTHLHRADASALGGESESFVQVRGTHDVEAGELLLGLGERPVDDHRRRLQALADGGRRRAELQTSPADEDALLEQATRIRRPRADSLFKTELAQSWAAASIRRRR